MHFETLPNEILVQVFLSLPTVSSVLNLASTCQRFHDVSISSKKLAILASAADAELGPIEGIIQLLTQNASQPAHIQRHVPISEVLLQQCIHVGRIAQRYEEIYPTKKWKHDYASRRSLSPHERFALRRALYRLWLYTAAFHNSTYVRTCRMLPSVLQERATLLHNYNPLELAEMLDVHTMMRDLIAKNICPSNGKVRQKYQKRFPDYLMGGGQQFLYNKHHDYPQNPSPFLAMFASPLESQSDVWSNSFPPPFTASRLSHYQSCASHQFQPSFSSFYEPGNEGWGDEISHYYIVEDMMKLNPAQILFLRDRCSSKAQVDLHVRGLGEWFLNNGETFSETVAFVCGQRGADVQEIRDKVEDCEWGVAIA